jgi:hypothetical protein
MSERRTDDTGLCALDCECPRCETGHRPTELERAAARRAEVLRFAALAKAARLAPAGPLPRHRLPTFHLPPPYTAEEREELDRLRASFRK